MLGSINRANDAHIYENHEAALPRSYNDLLSAFRDEKIPYSLEQNGNGFVPSLASRIVQRVKHAQEYNGQRLTKRRVHMKAAANASFVVHKLETGEQ